MKSQSNITKKIERILAEFDIPANSDLYERLQELLYVFYHSQDGIYVVDANGTTRNVNPAFEGLTGIAEKDMLDKNVQELVREGYFNDSVALKAIKAGKAQTIIQEYTNGKVALATANPIFDKRGDLVKIISNIRDITELTELYDKLSAKEKLLEDYTTQIIEQDLLETYGIVARSKAINTTVDMARRIARANGNVLLLGESGVGKSLVANMIVQMSDRKDKPFVTVNCAAIPEQLMESEIFGYVKGAFTGANAEGKAGLAEAADGGTLFLDEIGEVPISLQAKLLTFLETKEVMKIGSSKQKTVDVRVIASTNRDLKEMVKEGQFRSDLYYRLDVLSIYIPSLRERKDDILLLCQHYLKRANERNHVKKKIAPELMDFFLNYDWPGNVRQLINLLERLSVMSAEDEIKIDDLPKEYLQEAGLSQKKMFSEDISFPISLTETMTAIENRYIDAAIEQGGSLRNAAKLLGITYSSLYRRVKKEKR